jgi:hypothetical protein
MRAILTEVKASLKEFVQTGSFGHIELSMSHSTVEQYLGQPDVWEAAARDYQTATIWKYGDIEFYFQDDELYTIFMDDFQVLSGGSKIELNAWIINGSLTCAQAEHHFSAADIIYRKEEFSQNANGVHLVTATGAVLAFSGEDASRITLHSLHRRIEAQA